MIQLEIERVRYKDSFHSSVVFFFFTVLDGDSCLLINLIAAASILLASSWQNVSVPTKLEWKTKVDYICAMAKLSTSCSLKLGSFGAVEKFNKCWNSFIQPLLRS